MDGTMCFLVVEWDAFWINFSFSCFGAREAHIQSCFASFSLGSEFLCHFLANSGALVRLPSIPRK